MSLVPSGTDLVASLGLEEALVGVSASCDHPIARGKPVLTRAHVPLAPDVSPREVDRRVSEAFSSGAPLYETDAQMLRELAPTIVIAQDVCDVCAVGAADVILPEGARLVRLSATSIDGLYADLRALASAAGAGAEPVIASTRARLDAVRARVEGAARVRTIVLEWGDPPYAAGHWVPELVEIAGGVELLGRAGEPSRRIDPSEVRGADTILYAPCGYSLDETIAEAKRIDLTCWAIDATRLLSRCTPQIARAAEVIAGILHPDRIGAPSPSEAAELSPSRG